MAERKRVNVRADQIKKGDYAPHTHLTIKDVAPVEFRGKAMTVITFETDEQYMYRNNRMVVVQREVANLDFGTVAQIPGQRRVFKTSKGWVNDFGNPCYQQDDSFWEPHVLKF